MSRLRTITGISILLTFGLILLGAWVRATNSGLSLPGLADLLWLLGAVALGHPRRCRL